MDKLVSDWLEETDKVRCNWCMKVFEEKDIKVIGEKEFCPFCNIEGYLMDITEKEYQDQKDN